ncbi:MAG: ankyrin repeat domain-containing protein [Fibrella sp.]|nr:ankyrin repeat domain-containing protein [Armatimonadota bacterium]
MRKLPSSRDRAGVLCAAFVILGVTMPVFAQEPSPYAVVVHSENTERYLPDMPANRALRDAIGRSDLRAVQAALAAGASPEARVYDGGNPEYAVPLVLKATGFPENLPIFRLLAGRTRDVNIATPGYGMTLLMVATQSGDLALVKSLVVRGAKINARTNLLTNDSGKSVGGENVLLHFLTNAGFLEPDPHPVAVYLIAQGADVNAADANGVTPLIQAAQYKRPELTRLLLAKGADPQKRGPFDRTALRWAMFGGAEGVVAALRPATTLDLWEAAHFDDTARLRELLSGGADPNARRPEFLYDHKTGTSRVEPVGETPLAAAAKGDAAEAVRLLIASGANIHQKDPESGRNALHFAAASGSDAVIPVLLRAGADINAVVSPVPYVSTPLTIAVGATQPETVALLLKRGVNVGTNRQGEVALANLLRNAGREPFLRSRELRAGKAKRGEAFLDAQFTILDLLVSAGVSVDAVGAVAIVTQREQTGLVEYLLEKGGSPNAHFQYRDEDKTALMAAISAIREGQRASRVRPDKPLSVSEKRELRKRDDSLRECFDLLLKAGADVNDASRDTGETPLMTAIESGQYGIAGELLKRGAKLEATDKKGRTVLLRVAAEGKNTAAMTWLLRKKADSTRRDTAGYSALMLAIDDGSNAEWAAERERESDESDSDPPNRDGHPAMVALLIGNGADKKTVASDGITTALILAKKNGFSAVEALLAAKRK